MSLHMIKICDRDRRSFKTEENIFPTPLSIQRDIRKQKIGYIVKKRSACLSFCSYISTCVHFVFGFLPFSAVCFLKISQSNLLANKV